MTQAFHPPTIPRDHAATLDRLDRLAQRMDSAFGIPGTRIRVGWDSILGLVPGIGDALAIAPGLYIIGKARGMGAPTPLLLRMGTNSAVDFAVGSVPLVGDIFDIGFKSHRRNVALLRRHIETRT
ncbi:DUF4112 domain-containing protein [Anianabacter salinae]|uniref:DUF4112 domain-containing protein n=1 Tax=Anianabacter salinae TaxID=2851023 RepID=UPI00225DE24B|nr:DUF4112 domain-containing protein [Anianabacter salinae]MBV0911667.1 DUF4112 domain-containing protein [Anianabacter salinae]